MVEKKDIAHIKEKTILGLVEQVKLIGQTGEVETSALMDTGATRTSVDFSLAAKVGLGPIIKVRKIKKAEGSMRRVVVKGIIEIKGNKHECEITLADRKYMNQKILVGREIIHKDYLVDVEKSHKSHLMQDERKKDKY